LNIMHWLSRQLDPPSTAATTTATDFSPGRRRLFPRLFRVSPKWTTAAACVGGGW
jgi:hypothetical protein